MKTGTRQAPAKARGRYRQGKKAGVGGWWQSGGRVAEWGLGIVGVEEGDGL